MQFQILDHILVHVHILHTYHAPHWSNNYDNLVPLQSNNQSEYLLEGRTEKVLVPKTHQHKIHTQFQSFTIAHFETQKLPSYQVTKWSIIQCIYEVRFSGVGGRGDGCSELLSQEFNFCSRFFLW